MPAKIDSPLTTLELKCRRPVEHLLAGEYHSVFKGRGIEFEDARPYQPGDDVRAMEWKVTARTGTPHIKRYTEEREQFIYLLVDVSASLLDDPGGARRDTVAEICALITLAATKNNDRVGLILFSDRLELVVPPAKGHQHAQRVIEALMTFQPVGKGTSFPIALDCLGHMARKRSVFFVVSDFLADDFIDDLGALAIRHDINAVHLIDRRHRPGESRGLLRIHDSESGEPGLVDLAESRDEGARHQRNLQELLLNHGVDLMEVAVGENCVTALNDFFRSRQRRIDDETGG
ncbi:MAG: DUF58 domain-containing protein [Kiritimatiellae bacterium]|nr:DUF58 domain-containing protein [Kiritimatiellia bacterium]